METGCRQSDIRQVTNETDYVVVLGDICEKNQALRHEYVPLKHYFSAHTERIRGNIGHSIVSAVMFCSSCCKPVRSPNVSLLILAMIPFFTFEFNIGCNFYSVLENLIFAQQVQLII